MDKKALAQRIIEKLAPTAEEAVKLTGKERKAYLGALDTVHGSQAERAKALGFGDETYYHGSFRDINEFKPDKASPEGFMGKSIYTTNDPVDASWNYAHAEGPDVEDKIERLVERYKYDNDMNTTAALEKARKKVIGRVDSGAVYPLKLRTKNTADLDRAGQYIDLNPQYDESGELVSENPLVEKIMGGIRDKAESAEARLEGDRILGRLELYDEKTPRELYENVRNAAGESDISDKTGGLLSQEFARGALEDAGFDSARVNAHTEFSDMPNTTPNTEHTMVFDPKNVRSTNAAFDPRFKDSGLILAANGSKPNMGLGQAAGQLKSAYNRVMQPVDEIRNRIIQKIAAATDISNGKETVSKGTREEILNLAAPDVMDAVPVGKIGKLMGAAPIVANIIGKEGKILGAAEKAAPVLGREIKAGESAAEALINAPSSKYGKLVIKDTGPKVTSGTLQIKDNILKRLLPKNPMGSGI